MPKSKTVSVTLPAEIYEQVKTLTKETERTMSGQIRWFLIQIFREYRKNPHFLKEIFNWKLKK